MNKLIITNNESLTMSSTQLSELTGKRSDSVKRTIETLSNKGLVGFTQTVEKATGGRPSSTYHVNERDSYIVVAQLSPEFTAFLVDEWQKKKAPQHNIPQTYSAALLLAGQQAEQIELQNKQLELQAPKVKFVDNCVERGQLMTATQVAQKHKLSAVKLNRFLDELECVYNKAVKRGRAFKTGFVVDGLGEMKQTELGYSQALFTAKGEQWINQQLISEGVV